MAQRTLARRPRHTSNGTRAGPPVPKALTLDPTSAEVEAVIEALRHAIKSARRPAPVTLFVDSQAAILRLKKRGDRRTQAASHLASTLSNRGNTITIHWCPSHSGIPGNELADEVANMALKESPPVRPRVALGHLRSLRRVALEAAWEQVWAADVGRPDVAKAYRRTIQGLPTFKPHFRLHTSLRTHGLVRAYIGLKTGAGFTREYFYRCGLIDAPTCECGARQTPTHLILYCPLLGGPRAPMLDGLRKARLPRSMPAIFSTPKGQALLASFLRQAGLG